MPHADRPIEGADGPEAILPVPPVPAPIEELAAQVADRLAPIEREIVTGMSDLLSSIERLDDDPRMLDLLEASVAGNINTIINLLRKRIPLEQLRPTTAAVSYAIYLAERGIPVNSLIRAYHMGQEDLLEHVYREVAALEATDDQRFQVMRYLSRLIYRYIDWVVQHVTSVYTEERQRWDTMRLSVHSAVISNVLADQPAAAESLEAATGYLLDQNHIAVIAWLHDERGEAGGLPSIEAFARELNGRFGRGGPCLITAVDRSTVWMWIPRGADGGRLAGDELGSKKAASGVSSAVGLPGHGAAGFRRSLDQAEAARRVSLTSSHDRPHTGYGDLGVALVSLLAQDVEQAREWVASVLGELADDTPEAARLRETLRVLLRCGGSYTQAATQLHLHRNSIRYRVRKATGLRGRELDEDRLDVELALHTCHLLGSVVLRRPAPRSAR